MNRYSRRDRSRLLFLLPCRTMYMAFCSWSYIVKDDIEYRRDR